MLEKMLEELKKEVCEANKSLFTEGNVSGISEDRKYIVIKPSGREYNKLKKEDMVVVDLEGNKIEGKYSPSTDTPAHLEIYRNFPEINSIIHTHSTYATIFAQIKKPIPCLGTTHADNFYGTIPVTRELKKDEIEKNYEANIGKIISEILDIDIPVVLVASHGPFIFGKTIKDAVNNAAVLEKVAFMALNADSNKPISPVLLDKHYKRKHGKDSYYGQK
jgi:L-ribulose-5-phosphate 4-epimerase